MTLSRRAPARSSGWFQRRPAHVSASMSQGCIGTNGCDAECDEQEWRVLVFMDSRVLN